MIKWEAAALGGLVVLASVFLVPYLGAQSLWLDEGLTVQPVLEASDLPDLAARVRVYDTQPPGSHAVLYALRDLLPQTEVFLRLPSFLAIEGGILLLYALLTRLWGTKVALLAAAIAQLSPFLVFLGGEARNYGLWFFAVMASLFAMLRWCESVMARRTVGAGGAGPWFWLVGWGVVNGVGLWIHLFHLFLIMGELVLVVALFRGSCGGERSVALVASALLAQFIALAIFAPWLEGVTSALLAGTGGVGWTRPFTWANVPYYLFAFHFGFSLGPTLRDLHVEDVSSILAQHALTLTACGLAVAVSILAYGMLLKDALRHAERRWELLPLVALPLGGALGPVMYTIVSDFPLHPRHLIFIWPLIPVVISLASVRMRWLRPALAVTAALQLAALGNLVLDRDYWKDDERGAVQFAEKHSNGRSYVIGDVAFYYAVHVEGRRKGYMDFATHTDHVWFIDNRPWVPFNQHARQQLEARLARLGFIERKPHTQFRGIVLRHWTPREP